MKKILPILLLLTIVLAVFAYPAFKNNLWSVSFVKGFQEDALTSGQLSKAPESHPHARLLQARVAMAEQNYTLALLLIESLLPAKDPIILQTYAELLFLLERYTEAIEIWHGLGMYNKIEHAAGALKSTGDLEVRVFALQKAYEIRPEVYARSLLNALLEMANQLRDDGNVADSIPLYEVIIEQFPDSEEPFGELALAYMLLGETGPATNAIDKAMAFPSNSYQFYMRAGSIYEQTNNLVDSLEAYQNALRVCPTCQDAVQAIERISNP